MGELLPDGDLSLAAPGKPNFAPDCVGRVQPSEIGKLHRHAIPIPELGITRQTKSCGNGSNFSAERSDRRGAVVGDTGAVFQICFEDEDEFVSGPVRVPLLLRSFDPAVAHLLSLARRKLKKAD